MNEVGMEFISIYFGLRGYGPSGRSSPIPTSSTNFLFLQVPFSLPLHGLSLNSTLILSSIILIAHNSSNVLYLTVHVFVD